LAFQSPQIDHVPEVRRGSILERVGGWPGHLAETALFVDRLSKVYADGTHALDALELRLPAGSFFGLLGPAPARPPLL
jgi:hypothetical protein